MNRYRKSKKKPRHRVIAAYLRLRAYRILAIAAIAIGCLIAIGPRVVELNQYLDAQLERLRARK